MVWPCWWQAAREAAARELAAREAAAREAAAKAEAEARRAAEVLHALPHSPLADRALCFFVAAQGVSYIRYPLSVHTLLYKTSGLTCVYAVPCAMWTVQEQARAEAEALALMQAQQAEEEAKKRAEEVRRHRTSTHTPP